MNINVKIRLERFVGGLLVGLAVMISLVLISEMSIDNVMIILDRSQILTTSYTVLVVLASFCFSIERTDNTN